MSDRQHNYTEIGIVRSSDDIVTLLRGDFCDFGQWENSCTPEGKCPCCLAADEIERLREQVAEYKNLYLLRSRLGDAVGGV